jgi:YVTN family beta-propeller protein
MTHFPALGQHRFFHCSECCVFWWKKRRNYGFIPIAFGALAGLEHNAFRLRRRRIGFAFMKTVLTVCGWGVLACGFVLLGTMARGQSGENYDIYVSNERSDNVSVIDGVTRQTVATIPVGKRPRGIHVSPDGKTVYVAVSGTPPEPPPKLDANGNPIFQKGHDDDDDAKNADKSADGIAMIDVAQRKLVGKLPAGSDPEQFALSADGTRLFISNEDVGTASVLNIASGKVEKIIPVHKEPEGAGVRPDGKVFYITCETDGEIFAIDATTFKVITHFNVGGRPRSVDFLSDGTRAFIPSESAGQLHVIDSINHQVLETIALPKGSRPMCVKVSPDGKKVYAGAGRAGTICVMDAQSHQVLNSIKAGKRPWGIIISPDGKFLYSANGPSNDISVIDLETEKEVQRIPAGSSPWGIVLVPKGT